mgnify:CR=1 FL=1
MAGEGVLRDIDVGLAEGNPFTYVAAFGLFTDVSYSTPQVNKNHSTLSPARRAAGCSGEYYTQILPGIQ